MEKLNAFFANNRALIYFIGGLSFFSMGLASALQRRRFSRLRLARWLGLFAWFGILYGLNEWGNLFVPLQEQLLLPASATRLAILQLLARGAAMGLLFQFGTELLRPAGRAGRVWRWMPGTLILLWFLGLLYLWVGVRAPKDVILSTGDLLARYLLGFPGSVLSCLGLLEQDREVRAAGFPGIARYLLGAAISLAFFGLVGAILAVAGPFFPGEWLAYPTVLYAIGVFVPILRALDGVAMALLIGRALEVFEAETEALFADVERRNLLLADRERISRELHDGTIQSLYAAGLRLEDAYHTVLESPQEARRKIRGVMESLNQVIQEIRAYIFDLQQMGTEQSLIRRLADLVREVRLNTLLEIDFRVHGPRCAVPPDRAFQIYLAAQEALSNIVRHAQARRASVHLDFDATRLRLTVEDDGCGFVPEAALQAGKGMGLRNMQERAALLGGQLRIDSRPGGGTRVLLEAPCLCARPGGAEGSGDDASALAYPDRG
ncbi:MAG: sensor histidine kinase [Chloroflexia bacterium]